MPEIEQRAGPHGRDADRPPGILQSLSLGRTALTAWALAAGLGGATVGTAGGAPSEAGIAVTPVADSTTTPMGSDTSGG